MILHDITYIVKYLLFSAGICFVEVSAAKRDTLCYKKQNFGKKKSYFELLKFFSLPGPLHLHLWRLKYTYYATIGMKYEVIQT